MCDDHLIQCLEVTDCVDGVLMESCCNMRDIRRDTFRLEDGLDLVVSQNSKTFRCIAMLVLSVHRYKNFVFKELVKETVVERLNVCQTIRRFERSESDSDSGKDITLCDTSQRKITFDERGMRLLAICRSGGTNHRVIFKMTMYSEEPPLAGQPVLLSIGEYNLSSTMNGDKAELCLEKISQDEMGTIDENSDLARFLFRRSADNNLIKYESVRCQHWFISTTDQSVGMCMVGQGNINFRT